MRCVLLLYETHGAFSNVVTWIGTKHILVQLDRDKTGLHDNLDTVNPPFRVRGGYSFDIVSTIPQASLWW